MTRKTSETTIRCLVSTGMFSTERGVSIHLPDGRNIEAFVDRRHVIVVKEPTPGRQVEGHLKVNVVERQKKTVIVDLPEPAITVGPRLRIPTDFLEIRS